MRATVYMIAAIAAAGIMYVIASTPNPTTSDRAQEARSADASIDATPAVMSEAGTLTLSVPEMHCEFACFPKVKETLEGASGVEAVTLAAQAEEGVIDNRQVIVKYEPGFDLNAAIASLASAGYKNSELVP
jgi:copper chaperone CopZ